MLVYHYLEKNLRLSAGDFRFEGDGFSEVRCRFKTAVGVLGRQLGDEPD
jgi:hypothetical protein